MKKYVKLVISKNLERDARSTECKQMHSHSVLPVRILAAVLLAG